MKLDLKWELSHKSETKLRKVAGLSSKKTDQKREGGQGRARDLNPNAACPNQPSKGETQTNQPAYPLINKVFYKKNSIFLLFN